MQIPSGRKVQGRDVDQFGKVIMKTTRPPYIESDDWMRMNESTKRSLIDQHQQDLDMLMGKKERLAMLTHTIAEYERRHASPELRGDRVTAGFSGAGGASSSSSSSAVPLCSVCEVRVSDTRCLRRG